MRDPVLTSHAKAMRREMPEPELRLLLHLRAARFEGVKFRRQKVIGRYIVDFAANDPKLVIELDGDTHAFQEAYDGTRTRFLEREGYRVVRYSNLDVMQNLDGVLIDLAHVIEEMRSAPLPTLSPEGRGLKGFSGGAGLPLPFRGEGRGEGNTPHPPPKS